MIEPLVFRHEKEDDDDGIDDDGQCDDPCCGLLFVRRNLPGLVSHGFTLSLQ